MQGAVDAGIDGDTVLGCAARCAENGSALADNTQNLISCILRGGVPADGGTLGCSIECYLVDLSGF
jgi:hypothetical protein